MTEYTYINEAGKPCVAQFQDIGTYNWVAGTFPKVKTYLRDASYFKGRFEERLVNCRSVEKAEVAK